jgi:hypothetical protein
MRPLIEGLTGLGVFIELTMSHPSGANNLSEASGFLENGQNRVKNGRFFRVEKASFWTAQGRSTTMPSTQSFDSGTT